MPWRGLLLACAAGQLGARLVPLPGGLGGVEGGVLGALALTGTHPATALTAVIVYRVAGYWAPGAAGRRHGRCPHPPPPGPGRPAGDPAAPAVGSGGDHGAAAQPKAGGIRRAARAADRACRQARRR